MKVKHRTLLIAVLIIMSCAVVYTDARANDYSQFDDLACLAVYGYVETVFEKQGKPIAAKAVNDERLKFVAYFAKRWPNMNLNELRTRLEQIADLTIEYVLIDPEKNFNDLIVMLTKCGNHAEENGS